MTVRLHALVCLGLVLALGLPIAARAAGDTGLSTFVAATVADAGSSNREARSRATEAVPLDRMAPVERQIAAEQAKRVVADRTFPNNAHKLLEACGLVKRES